jgi:hypothetical protein
VLGVVLFGSIGGLGLYLQSAGRALARSRVQTQCSDIAAPARYLGWDGTVQRFEVMNQAVALEFMNSNAKKLVNLEPGQAAALASHQAREAAPSQAVESRLFDEAIRRIESAKTSAGRRSALARAQVLKLSPELTARLNLEASRIEVDAALEKADGMKTRASKRRCLQQALEAVRADEVDDALQKDQIRWLEEAIAAVDAE